MAVLAEPHNAVKVSTACPSSLGYSRMPLFIYRCPNTGYRLQGFVAIAHFLELPRKTTRRHLETLVRFGLLTRRDRNYSPTEWAVHNYTNKAADLVKETATML